eukprot:CAMPEP_0119307836 /NCGR_PEP_ID=MMETSP1333-20130426/8219_1 /TAXON_ID=418940 /ORGANISM="Scyphosphaera apsteinii, Strain RCC1455" /LENGTH=512 /DNA_ID=CAMNT_0007311471 /DNA_START=47 /DNA_END=1585 /DNA_ORIENTATION=+
MGDAAYWETVHGLLTDEEQLVEFCQRHLQTADADVDETIDTQEARVATASIISELFCCHRDWQPSAARLDAVFARCDTNEDGTLQAEEFTAFVTKLLQFTQTFLEKRLAKTNAEQPSLTPQVRKRVVAPDGQTFANRGLRPNYALPSKASSWSRSVEGDLPAKVDLRPYCSPVEDQKQSNSCCANAVAGAFEYLNTRYAQQNGDEPGDVSRLFIYYVGRKVDQQRYGDATKRPKDEGLTLSGAIEAMQMKGACLASTYPFDLSAVNAMPPSEAFDEARSFKVSGARSVNVDLDEIRECLAEGYPIIFGLKLTKPFFRPPPSGRIRTPNPDDPQSAEHGLHAMLLVGYMDREELFIVRNSWGEDWGVGGYCYLPYDYVANTDFNVCGMFAIEGLTEVDLTPDDDDGEGFEEADDDDDDFELEEEELEDEEDEEEVDFNDDDFFSPIAEARRVFNQFDLDGSGTMGWTELFIALRLCGIRVWPHETSALMAEYDADRSGSLDFAEFCRFQGIEI